MNYDEYKLMNPWDATEENWKEKAITEYRLFKMYEERFKKIQKKQQKINDIIYISSLIFWILSWFYIASQF